ncbi:MAG: hypothetical protein J6Y54_02965, partial [Lentisphaeria bacterium]|nr:hypothetical protein [Lentisphaeria bacterium]
MKKSENDTNFKAQSYLRLLKFTAPYWKRLTFGIICGMLVGGSLFFALMLLPQLVGLVDNGSNIGASTKTKQSTVSSQELQKLNDIAAKSDIDAAEKEKQMREVLDRQEEDADPKLTELLKQTSSIIRRFRLPCRLEGKTLRIYWPVEKSFDVVSSDGRVAWQLFAIYTSAFI